MASVSNTQVDGFLKVMTNNAGTTPSQMLLNESALPELLASTHAERFC